MSQNELIDRIDQQFQLEKSNYNHLVYKLQKKIKTNSVHDLRVSSQKIALFLDLQKILVSSNQHNKIIKRKNRIVFLKKRMSKLRDCQVQNKIFKNLFPANQFLKIFFKKKKKREMKKLKPFLEKSKMSFSFSTPKENPKDRLMKFYESLVFDTQKKIYEAKNNPDADHLHLLRKSLKRLMYLTGIFNDIGIETEITQAFLKEFQKTLGQVQDVTMTIQTLNEFIPDCPPELRQAMINYRLDNQLLQNESIRNTIDKLERSSLWPN